MFDTELVYSSLKQIQGAVELIIERSETVNNVDDFLTSPGGVLRLDALCMNLIALGEAVKGLDKLTDGQLLPKYPEVYWQGIMKMRDKIAHHYFEIDADIVFKTLKEDIPPLLPVVEKIIQSIL
ncbi:MAG: DUF86 domain-containing protein [Bacteroidaceae bacterium]|nr:DUF86 domain-containing protein [Bacteroidaceae bacterium]